VALRLTRNCHQQAVVYQKEGFSLAGELKRSVSTQIQQKLNAATTEMLNRYSISPIKNKNYHVQNAGKRRHNIDCGAL
jgi:hypothetical protein